MMTDLTPESAPKDLLTGVVVTLCHLCLKPVLQASVVNETNATTTFAD